MKLIATTALAALLACPALADPNCADNDSMEAILVQKYGEQPIATGINKNGHLVIWWGNPGTGSWTATITSGGQTCIVSEGTAFKRVVLAPNV